MKTGRTIFTLLYSLILALALAGPAQAKLIDRGGGFIYDDVLDITWTQNANINGGGEGWLTQVHWADSLSLFDSVRNVTWEDWRLPTTKQPDASCSDQNIRGVPGQSGGFNCTGSEMGHLFNIEGISAAAPGPFINLEASGYWSGTGFAPSSSFLAWAFDSALAHSLITVNSPEASPGPSVTAMWPPPPRSIFSALHPQCHLATLAHC